MFLKYNLYIDVIRSFYWYFIYQKLIKIIQDNVNVLYIF